MAASRGDGALAEARRAADHLADVVDRLVAGSSMLDRAVLAELAVVVAEVALPAAGVYERLVLLEAAR